MKIKVASYITKEGIDPFAKWFDKLNAIAAAKVSTALYRMELGNYSNVKSLGDGVFEYKIDFGPGYRIYFGQDGEELVILVGGGSKKQQDKDIKIAKNYWQEYKLAKRRG
ncbi:TPA: type II toxin-antitoxin system RelE/ParE family toxin [Legionella pneumophila]|uniref:Addiction module killer protein n=2 Tax=Legionella TaxID=445 RepID=A0A378P8R8_9GAMM|nr:MULTISPECIES: type II toxin-antitoxin system RelE/ParE family toxin [Legionella]HAT1722196.1 type II toxin-antitoxin system RelE/ParE family toxin [Legionella pneumophila]KTC69578.1 Addiction module killer protein [Legionella bozemanae]KTD53952.1 Addiction module killer protein [Legionella quateirensis]STP13856.1 putative addiction module killer protein [Legionella bozemanae]STY82995.1 Addiction module killer protein HI1419 [Legionella quateirensis]